MSDWLKRIFVGSVAAEPPTPIGRFSTKDTTLSQDSIIVEGEGWLIDAEEPRVVRLFEVADPDAENCLLAYRATMKSEGLEGRAYLEMWCRLPGKGEFFSKGLNQPLSGTTGWGSYQIPFRLRKGQRPDLIKLNVAVEGRGKLWIKDVELLKSHL